MDFDYYFSVILTVPWIYENNNKKIPQYIKIHIGSINIYDSYSTNFYQAEEEYIENYGFNLKGTIMTYDFVSNYLNKILYYAFLKKREETKDINMKKYIFDNFLLDINKLSFVDDNLKVNLHSKIGLIAIKGECKKFNDRENLFQNMIGNKYFDKYLKNSYYEEAEDKSNVSKIILRDYVWENYLSLKKLVNRFPLIVQEFITDITKVNINIDKTQYSKYEEFEKNQKIIKLANNISNNIAEIQHIKNKHDKSLLEILRMINEIKEDIDKEIEKDNNEIVDDENSDEEIIIDEIVEESDEESVEEKEGETP